MAKNFEKTSTDIYVSWDQVHLCFFGAISSIGLLFFVFLGMQPWYINTYIYVSWDQVHQS